MPSEGCTDCDPATLLHRAGSKCCPHARGRAPAAPCQPRVWLRLPKPASAAALPRRVQSGGGGVSSSTPRTWWLQDPDTSHSCEDSSLLRTSSGHREPGLVLRLLHSARAGGTGQDLSSQPCSRGARRGSTSAPPSQSALGAALDSRRQQGTLWGGGTHTGVRAGGPGTAPHGVRTRVC